MQGMSYKQNQSFYIDRTLLGAVFGLLTIGLLMVTSASMVISDTHFGHPFHFFFHQLIYLVVGVLIGAATTHVSLERWERLSPYLLVFGLVLLVLVLVPGIGRQVNGSRRWLSFMVLRFQVSELVKLAVILFMSGYLVRRLQEVRTQASGFAKPIMLLGLVGGLLLLEPDFGATSVVVLVSLGMMFLAGVRLSHFLGLMFGVLGSFGLLIVSAPYRLQRLTAFLDPWANQFNSGYQLTQSLIAFGRGGAWGVGLGNSVQKLFYLPEAHTDFLFAVLAEEFGMMGELVVCALFAVLVMRAFAIGRVMERCDQLFAAYTAYGIGLWFALQTMVNIGVNMGVLPTKGLTLPLMSYGGSSLLIGCVAIAILLRIYHESQNAVQSTSRSGSSKRTNGYNKPVTHGGVKIYRPV